MEIQQKTNGNLSQIAGCVQGDVIGCYLHLGEGGRPFEKERSVSCPRDIMPFDCHLCWHTVAEWWVLHA